MLIAQRPVLSEEVVNESRSRFIIEPLEPGFGYTLGNSLRRTQLCGGNIFQATSKGTNGGAHCADNDYFTAHLYLLRIELNLNSKSHLLRLQGTDKS